MTLEPPTVAEMAEETGVDEDVIRDELEGVNRVGVDGEDAEEEESPTCPEPEETA